MKEIKLYVDSNYFTIESVLDMNNVIGAYVSYEYFDTYIIKTRYNIFLAKQINSNYYDILEIFLDKKGIHIGQRYIAYLNDVNKLKLDWSIIFDLTTMSDGNKYQILAETMFASCYYVKTHKNIIVQYDKETNRYIFKYKNDLGIHEIEYI